MAKETESQAPEEQVTPEQQEGCEEAPKEQEGSSSKEGDEEGAKQGGDQQQEQINYRLVEL
jgi:hypothetical protein